MAYPISIYVKTATTSKFQVRDTDLSLIRTWTLSAVSGITIYSFSIDSLGSVYFGRANTYVYQYDENGNLITYKTSLAQKVYSTSINIYDYICDHQLGSTGHFYVIKGWTRGTGMTGAGLAGITLPTDELTYRPVMVCDNEDPYTFYVARLDGSWYIEKWKSKPTIQMLADRVVNHGSPSFTLIGNYIYGGTNAGHEADDNTGIVWRINKYLSADQDVLIEIQPDDITTGNGEDEKFECTNDIYIGRLSETTFVVGFRGIAFYWDTEFETWAMLKTWTAYLRVYTIQGVQVGITVDLGSDVTLAIPGNYYETSQDLAVIDTMIPTWTEYFNGYVYSATYRMNIVSGSCYLIGWEWYDVLTPTDIKNFNSGLLLFALPGENTYLLTGGGRHAIGHTYMIRARADNGNGLVYGEWIEFSVPPITITNVKAETHSEQSAIRLYGNVAENIPSNITQQGFEYLIQDTEPSQEDSGIAIIKEKPLYIEYWEDGEFYAFEYEGNDVDFWDRLYQQEENTIWWFRAFCMIGEAIWKADSWMKNVPSVTTFECTLVESQQATANGELTDKGANIVTERGFRVIKEYVGDLFSAIPYEYDGFNCDNLQSEELLSPDGVLIGFQWVGDLYRDSLEEGNFDLGIYEKILGGGFLGEDFGIYLKPNDTYKVQAIGVNQLGIGFGEEVDLVTGQIILPSEDDEIISETIAEKTITLGTIPDGCTVTRIGIRLGRTTGCTDIHVYEDGSWGSGGSHTFLITGFVPGSTYYKMPYIILNHGDYEEEIKAIPDYRNPERAEEWLEDFPIEVFPDVEDEDDLDQTVTDSSVGDISYRTIIKEIKCEKIGEQSFIDMYGRRRSQTINNHLIQTHENCKTIAIEYVEKFQILKMKIAIDYDIPIPFEREDVILLGDGKHKYREDGEGLIAFMADGAGTILQQSFILAKIRKIDSNYISGTELILSLELEV